MGTKGQHATPITPKPPNHCYRASNTSRRCKARKTPPIERHLLFVVRWNSRYTKIFKKVSFGKTTHLGQLLRSESHRKVWMVRTGHELAQNRCDEGLLEVSMLENTFHFPFLIRLSTGDWWVLISERRGKELPEFSFGVYGSRSRTMTLDFLLGRSPWFGWPAGVEDCLESPWSQQKPGVCTDRKLFRLEDFKFRFGGCTPAYRASVLLAFLRSIVRADGGSRRTGERLVASCYVELV